MNERYSRQSFLGEQGQASIERARIGLVGLGGGGSHEALQFAHVGVENFALFDADSADESNLNRTVTLTETDVGANTLKVEAAKRRILAVNSRANVEVYPSRWQDHPAALRACDIVCGNVDSFTERQQLEAFCRRHLIPYIDIGMDVHQVGDEPSRICGQVILSMPGHACMFCMDFLSPEKLGREANNYGAAGGRPQVVWSNGVLASIAVGVAIDLLTNWSRKLCGPVWLVYLADSGTVMPESVRLPRVPKLCPHFPLDLLGEPDFTPL